jgi:hypothetical protein
MLFTSFVDAANRRQLKPKQFLINLINGWSTYDENGGVVEEYGSIIDTGDWPGDIDDLYENEGIDVTQPIVDFICRCARIEQIINFCAYLEKKFSDIDKTYNRPVERTVYIPIWLDEIVKEEEKCYGFGLNKFIRDALKDHLGVQQPSFEDNNGHSNSEQPLR